MKPYFFLDFAHASIDHQLPFIKTGYMFRELDLSMPFRSYVGIEKTI